MHLLHIAQPLRGTRVLRLGAAPITMNADPEPLQNAEKKVVGSAEDIATGHGFPKVAVSAAGGEPAARITRYAKDKNLEMMVTVSRGLRELSGLLMGGISHKLSHLAPFACVTVR